MICLLLVSFSAWASVGEIVTGERIELERQGITQTVSAGFELETGDTLTVTSGDAQVHIFPATQINLSAPTKFIIEESSLEAETSFSLLRLLSGGMRLLMEKFSDGTEQRVKVRETLFAVRGTEFEVEASDDGEDLQVYEGEVEVLDAQDKKSLGKISKNRRVRVKRKALEERRFAKRERRLKFRDQGELKQRWEKRRERRKQPRRTGVRKEGRRERKRR